MCVCWLWVGLVGASKRSVHGINFNLCCLSSRRQLCNLFGFCVAAQKDTSSTSVSSPSPRLSMRAKIAP